MAEYGIMADKLSGAVEVPGISGGDIINFSDERIFRNGDMVLYPTESGAFSVGVVVISPGVSTVTNAGTGETVKNLSKSEINQAFKVIGIEKKCPDTPDYGSKSVKYS